MKYVEVVAAALEGVPHPPRVVVTEAGVVPQRRTPLGVKVLVHEELRRQDAEVVVQLEIAEREVAGVDIAASVDLPQVTAETDGDRTAARCRVEDFRGVAGLPVQKVDAGPVLQLLDALRREVGAAARRGF
ncbi:hypothetical protein ACJWDR_00175 [Streptomyces tauricus]|uniref:hypothetical protein n=1 Tax=Streptomyces tauricus TaxID=68274 RepID=UPI00387F2E6C